MESAHTPGPWKHGFESVDPEWAIVTVAGGLIVANVNSHHRQEANARLIAAAPDLLAALKAILAIVEEAKWGQRWPGRPHAECDAARAAIAKAEGL